MMTPETKAKLDAFAATRPAFTGPVMRQPMPGKAARRTAKAKLVKIAGGK